MTADEILGFVAANVDELRARKRRMEEEMHPLPDIAWQYASGMCEGAAEVYRNLYRALKAADPRWVVGLPENK